jgi:hypothetical protein
MTTIKERIANTEASNSAKTSASQSDASSVTGSDENGQARADMRSKIDHAIANIDVHSTAYCQAGMRQAIKFAIKAGLTQSERIDICRSIAARTSLPIEYVLSVFNRVNHQTGRKVPSLPVVVGGTAQQGPSSVHGGAVQSHTTPPGRPAQANALLAALSNAQFYRDTVSDNACGDLYESGVRLTYVINSRQFRNALVRLSCPLNGGKAMSRSAIDTVIDTCAARAKQGQPREVFLRSGSVGNKAWIDLGNDMGHCIYITPEGWSIVSYAGVPISFWRPSGMLSLPVPEKVSDAAEAISLLQKAFHLSADHALLMAIALAAILVGRKPNPILNFIGPPGSAKTTTMRGCRNLIDPVRSPHINKPAGVEDLMVMARSNAIVAIDNVSRFDEDLLDAICGLATGQGHGDRAHYTNDEATDFFSCRPVMITSIASTLGRGDALSRTLDIDVQRIMSKDRKLIGEVEANFEQVRPRLLGALLEIASTGLRGTARPRDLPRMADFYTWGVNASVGLVPPGTFEKVFHDNKRQQGRRFAEDNLVILAIGGLFDLHDPTRASQTGVIGYRVNRPSVVTPALRGTLDFDAGGRIARWCGRMNELLDDLGTVHGDGNHKPTSWPQVPRSLRVELDHIAELLEEALGIRVLHGGSQHRPRVELLR